MKGPVMLEMKYFVLKPKAKAIDDPYATASQQAMLAYADALGMADPELSQELRAWATREISAQLALPIKE